MRLPTSLFIVSNDFWEKIPSSLLFVVVLLSFPAFLFQKNLWILVGESSTFFFLALSRRGKVRLLPSLLMVAGITFFTLFSPHGQVMARLGSFTITRGALESGLTRGLTLAGMVFLSQLAMAPGINLPGRVGKFIVRMFSVLDELRKETSILPNSLKKDTKKGLFRSFQSIKKIVSELDQRLYEVYWNSCEEVNNKEGVVKSISKKDKKDKGICKLFCIGIVFLFPVILYLLLLME